MLIFMKMILKLLLFKTFMLKIRKKLMFVHDIQQDGGIGAF